jgi:hypothetical protein
MGKRLWEELGMDFSLKSPSFIALIVLLGVATAVGNRLVAQEAIAEPVSSGVNASVEFGF